MALRYGTPIRRRLALSTVLAVGSLAAAAQPAAAAMEWCTQEPPVMVQVHGRPVLVNVFVGVPAGFANLLHTAQVTGSASGDTVTISVVGPAVPFTATARIAKLGLSTADSADSTMVYSPGSTATLILHGVTP